MGNNANDKTYKYFDRIWKGIDPQGAMEDDE